MISSDSNNKASGILSRTSVMFVSACDPKYWGEDCKNLCSPGCYNNECNKVDGTCSCKFSWTGQRWEGERCDKCVQGYWGLHCQQTCSNKCRIYGTEEAACFKDKGHCDYCVKGYWGPKCKQTCSGGCSKDECSNNGRCSCNPGWWGQECDQRCPEHCRLSNRVTHGCLQNSNGDCTVCKEGYHGYKCEEKCPSNCEGPCEKSDGECSCRAGTYGSNCDKNCSVNCATERCEKNDGHCICKPGYKTGCEEGKYNKIIILLKSLDY